jgi:hypothetical protein
VGCLQVVGADANRGADLIAWVSPRHLHMRAAPGFRVSSNDGGSAVANLIS